MEDGIFELDLRINRQASGPEGVLSAAELYTLLSKPKQGGEPWELEWLKDYVRLMTQVQKPPYNVELHHGHKLWCEDGGELITVLYSDTNPSAWTLNQTAMALAFDEWLGDELGDSCIMFIPKDYDSPKIVVTEDDVTLELDMDLQSGQDMFDILHNLYAMNIVDDTSWYEHIADELTTRYELHDLNDAYTRRLGLTEPVRLNDLRDYLHDILRGATLDSTGWPVWRDEDVLLAARLMGLADHWGPS